jgi:glycosyltransferase involved in cell wall biosynthesis
MRILHCLRAPVGGLFRHVVDLARQQAADGHQVGVLADSSTGGPAAEAAFTSLYSSLSLGITRVRMPRQLGIADYTALSAAQKLARDLKIDVLHGHGAKGGAYARLAASRLKRSGLPVKAFYTPHGGSLHFEPGTLQGTLFLGLEQHLATQTDGIIFESAFSQRAYRAKVGVPPCPERVIPNGLLPSDFSEVAPSPKACDVLFVGELRHLKGVDVLLEALAQIETPHAPTATIVGGGPEAEAFKARAAELGLAGRVTFPGPMPAPKAFPLGRCIVVPSRAESFPYIVLEAAAAGLPMLMTGVGGIPEITAGLDVPFLIPGDAASLAQLLQAFLANPAPFQAQAQALRHKVADRFTVARMAAEIEAFYGAVRRR